MSKITLREHEVRHGVKKDTKEERRENWWLEDV